MDLVCLGLRGLDCWSKSTAESGDRMTRGVIIFWFLFIGFIAWDYSAKEYPRVEPAPIALGSGQAASGGHCSGR
jgi:hypothetical protein